METIAAPWQQLEGQEVHGRYPLQKCLAEGERQATFETLYRDKPAIIKLIRPDSSQSAFRLLAGIDAGKGIRHPNLIEIFDSGDTRVDGVRYVYAVMERADENLGHVLRERTLDSDELRELLNGALSALDFLHSESLIHTAIKPSNVLAVGDSLKLSSDGFHPASMPRALRKRRESTMHRKQDRGPMFQHPTSTRWPFYCEKLQPEAQRKAPWDRVPLPFAAILRGGLIRDPQQRWTIGRIRAVLNGEAVPFEPAPIPVAAKSNAMAFNDAALNDAALDDAEKVPLYRKFRGLAIAGALAAGTAVALILRSAHPAAPVPEKAAPQAPSAAVTIPKPSPTGAAPKVRKAPGAETGGETWAVVAASFKKASDAEKRAHAIRKHHNSLHPQVVSAGASRFLVVFGKGLSEQQARTIEQRAKRSGAAPDVFVTQLE